MKSMFVWSGTSFRSFIEQPQICSSRGPGAADPKRNQHAGEIDRGEHRGDDADQQHDREAAHRARAEIGHDRGRDDVGDVGVENGAERLAVAGLDRVDQPSPAADFLADSLVDQHVGVDRRADGQDEAGDARQGQRGVEQRHGREDQEAVHDQGDRRIDAEPSVGDEHEDDDAERPDEAGDHALVNRILAELGADGPLLDHVQFDRQLARGKRDREVVRALDREIAADLGASAQDRLIDVGRGQDLVIEDDRERLVDILLGHSPETPGAGRVERDSTVGRPSWSKP